MSQGNWVVVILLVVVLVLVAWVAVRVNDVGQKVNEAGQKAEACCSESRTALQKLQEQTPTESKRITPGTGPYITVEPDETHPAVTVWKMESSAVNAGAPGVLRRDAQGPVLVFDTGSGTTKRVKTMAMRVTGNSGTHTVTVAKQNGEFTWSVDGNPISSYCDTNAQDPSYPDCLDSGLPAEAFGRVSNFTLEFDSGSPLTDFQKVVLQASQP